MEHLKSLRQEQLSNSQPRVGHTPRRKQYQSCDHCRKRRRACDAISLGIDPFRLSDVADDDENQNKACTTCQKSGIQCTFEWLLYRPRQNLPQGIKRKLNAAHPISPETNSDNVFTPHQDSETGSPWPTPSDYNSPMSFQGDCPQSFEQEPYHSRTMSHSEHFAPPWNDQLNSFGVFPLDPALNSLDNQVPVFASEDNDLTVPSFDRLKAGASAMATTSVSPTPAFSRFEMPTESSQPEEDRFSEALEIMVELDSTTILPSSSRYSSYEYPLASPQVPYDTSSRGSISSVCSFPIQRCSTNDSMESSERVASLHDHQHSQERRKSAIIAELTQIYNQSMANALDAWAPRKHSCACERKGPMLETRVIVQHHPQLCAPAQNMQNACACNGFSC